MGHVNVRKVLKEPPRPVWAVCAFIESRRIAIPGLCPGKRGVPAEGWVPKGETSAVPRALPVGSHISYTLFEFHQNFPGEDMKTLKDKTVVITGAGSGIGRALAQALAKEGARLALADKNPAGLRETLSLLKGAA